MLYIMCLAPLWHIMNLVQSFGIGNSVNSNSVTPLSIIGQFCSTQLFVNTLPQMLIAITKYAKSLVIFHYYSPEFLTV